jgi:hypothetical protein
MSHRNANKAPPDYIRADLIASAIVLRNCSLQLGISTPVRFAYRAQMRAQAIKWREAPRNGTRS